MITQFVENNRFLSNFYPVPVGFDGLIYPSVEHAYQAAKTNIDTERVDIRNCATAGRAKRMGATVTLRPDWEDIKIDTMRRLLWRKFSKNPSLKSALLATGDQKLIEGNQWGDVFWGAVLRNGEWVGHNNLGKLLMEVRSMLQ